MSEAPKINSITKEANEREISTFDSIESWEKRYAEQLHPFDWLVPYEDLKADLKVLLEILKKTGKKLDDLKILNIGCGTSTLSEMIYKELGIKNITNIDISKNLIKQLQEKNKFEGMSYLVKDAITEDISEGGPFDLIIDKFTSDTFLCLDECFDKMISYFRNVFLALNESGIYFIVSGKEDRDFLLQATKLPFSIFKKVMKINFVYQPEQKKGEPIPAPEYLNMDTYLYSCQKTDSNFDNQILEKMIKKYRENTAKLEKFLNDPRINLMLKDLEGIEEPGRPKIENPEGINFAELIPKKRAEFESLKKELNMAIEQAKKLLENKQLERTSKKEEQAAGKNEERNFRKGGEPILNKGGEPFGSNNEEPFGRKIEELFDNKGEEEHN